MEENKRKTVEFIKNIVAEGKKVYGYGASTKGNTLLQYFGLDNNLIMAAAERNPDKWGKMTVGTNIPIISEEEARKAKDFVRADELRQAIEKEGYLIEDTPDGYRIKKKF